MPTDSGGLDENGFFVSPVLQDRNGFLARRKVFFRDGWMEDYYTARAALDEKARMVTEWTELTEKDKRKLERNAGLAAGKLPGPAERWFDSEHMRLKSIVRRLGEDVEKLRRKQVCNPLDPRAISSPLDLPA